MQLLSTFVTALAFASSILASAGISRDIQARIPTPNPLAITNFTFIVRLCLPHKGWRWHYNLRFLRSQRLKLALGHSVSCRVTQTFSPFADQIYIRSVAFAATTNRGVNIKSISAALGYNKTVYVTFSHTFKNGLALPGKVSTVGPSVNSGNIPNFKFPLTVKALEKAIGSTQHGTINILSLNASLVWVLSDKMS